MVGAVEGGGRLLAPPRWVGWARVGVLPGPRESCIHFCLLILFCLLGESSHLEGCSTDMVIGWTQGSWGRQACRFPGHLKATPEASAGRVGLPLPGPQVSAANMYVLVSFVLIFGCFLSLPFFAQTPLLPQPQRGKPRAADKRLFLGLKVNFCLRTLPVLRLSHMDKVPGS